MGLTELEWRRISAAVGRIADVTDGDDASFLLDCIEKLQTQLDESTIKLSHYSAALDEIFRLRTALAFEALVTEAHLGYRTFPKTRRRYAEEQAERMRECARGQALTAFAGRSWQSLRTGLREAGAAETLTREQWETEHGQ